MSLILKEEHIVSDRMPFADDIMDVIKAFQVRAAKKGSTDVRMNFPAIGSREERRVEMHLLAYK